MAEPRANLPKAPAREALIDIQFDPPISLGDIHGFVDVAAPSFQSATPLFEALVGFTNDGASPTAAQTQIGWRMDNPQTHYVLQARVAGFTLSRLSPYGKWEDLRGEASKWWMLFWEHVKPKVINRIAVRYVNAIKIPLLPAFDFHEYLTCVPRLPEGVPQAMSGFLQRVVIPDDANRCTAIVTQALEGPPTTDGEVDSITVLLDVDVFRNTFIEGGGNDALWAGLDDLRQTKNRMFFAHVTEKNCGDVPMTTFAFGAHAGFTVGLEAPSAGPTAARVAKLTVEVLAQLKTRVSAGSSLVFNDLQSLAREQQEITGKGVFEVAQRFLLALPSSLPAPELATDSDGEVVFDWAGSAGRLFTLAIRADGRLSYAARLTSYDKDHGSKKFLDEIPAHVLGLIHRVTSV